MPDILVYQIIAQSIEQIPTTAKTMDEATLQTGHGIYSVFRLYPGTRVLRLDHHLSRMRRSAEALDTPFPLSNEWLREATRSAVEQAGIDLPRIRLTVPFSNPESVIVAIEPFNPPSAGVTAEGVRVALCQGRRERPTAKDSRFIETRSQLKANHANVYELLLVDKGYILEGASSNFYAILEGRLHTANTGMLEGIARSIVLSVAPAILPVELTPVHIDQLPQVTEAMITSASRGVLPVVEIDGNPLGNGKPGSFTDKIRSAYDALVEQELETL
nr:aminotransferase class IV family protein [Anaerolineae bacterium]